MGAAMFLHLIFFQYTFSNKKERLKWKQTKQLEHKEDFNLFERFNEIVIWNGDNRGVICIVIPTLENSRVDEIARDIWPIG